MYLGRRGPYYFSFWVAYATADGWIGETRLQAVNWEFCDTPAGIVLIAPTDNPDSCPTRGTAAVPEPCVIVSRGDLFNLSRQRRPQLFLFGAIPLAVTQTYASTDSEREKHLHCD